MWGSRRGAWLCGEAETINNYNALELKVKAERKRKVHRSAVDMDGGWISKFLGDND